MNYLIIFIIFIFDRNAAHAGHTVANTTARLLNEKNKILAETIKNLSASEIELKNYYQKKNLKPADIAGLKKIESNLKSLKIILNSNRFLSH